MTRVQRILIQRGVALSSTPAILEAQSPDRPAADERTLLAMHPSFLQRYRTQRERMDARGGDWYFKPDWLERALAYDLAFYRAGGLLTAGPDPGLHNLPGFGDQRNFELFVEAGFEPEEAVQVMTSNGAKSL
ncbi:amidohydrolase, partial [Lysobacter sp. D1-1-M9]